MPVLVRPRYQDPFIPVLLSSPGLPVTEEQKTLIREVLSISSSDEQFAEKAYKAITYILTHGVDKIPTVTSLTPNSAEIGDPNFTIHVHGTNFTSLSKIIFNGYEEPTTFVSATELTTGIDMSVWTAPSLPLPVAVQSEDGVISNAITFTFTDGTPAALSTPAPAFKAPAANVKK